MKRFASFLLALMMLLALAACGEGGLNFNLKETESPGYKEGYVGDTMSTYWFDFTVDEAYSCTEYEGYLPDPGYKFVVATITLKNTCGFSVDMWDTDFVILWDAEDDYMDIPLAPGLSADQFPEEYVLGINATKTGVAVYEVPEGYRDFSIAFMEVYEDEGNPDGRDGDVYYVDFTPEER